MSTVIQICNTALARLGIDQFIEDLTDRDARARACNQFYDQCRQEVIQDFPWNFARGYVQLAQLTTSPPPGFGYVYRYPSDCLQARVITDGCGYRLRDPFNHSALTWDSWSMWIGARATFEVFNDRDVPGAKMIATDIPQAWLWYTVNADQPTSMTPLFRSALAWRLAAEIAGALRVDARLRASAQEAYQWAVSQAQASSLNESQPDRYPDSPSIQARA